MNNQIKKHLEKRGVRLMKEKRTDGLFGPDRRTACFFKWFFEEVMCFDSLEYRRQFWRAASRYGHTIGDMPRTVLEFTDPKKNPYNQWFVNLVFMMIMMGVSAVIWFLVKETARHVRRLRRPTYYENERARRMTLAEERRRIHARSTVNACPTPDHLKKAFENARLSSSNMIRFGSLLEDLECFVNNKPYWSLDTGRIVGRHGGIRQWLRDNAPELSERYKTVMRYKALSKKFRQAVGISDPIPASAVLPEADGPHENEMQSEEKDAGRADIGGNRDERKEREDNENIAWTNSKRGVSVFESDKKREVELRGRSRLSGTTGSGMLRNENMVRTKRIAREILGTCEGTVVSLEARVMLYIGQEFIPEKRFVLQKGRTKELFPKMELL